MTFWRVSIVTHFLSEASQHPLCMQARQIDQIFKVNQTKCTHTSLITDYSNMHLSALTINTGKKFTSFQKNDFGQERGSKANCQEGLKISSTIGSQGGLQK